jgi:hypothetical protein
MSELLARDRRRFRELYEMSDLQPRPQNAYGRKTHCSLCQATSAVIAKGFVAVIALCIIASMTLRF